MTGYIGGIASLDHGTGYYTKEEADATFYKIGDDTGIVHTQRFIASSSTRTYSMARTPINKNNTFVYINGAYQNKETYNVTSNVLTLGDDPIDGQEIEVVIISSIEHYTQDLSPHNLEYHPVADGVPVISIEDKLRSISGFVDHAKQDSLISDLYNISGVHDAVLFVSGFWEQADGSGGMFFWDSNEPKLRHNGGTIIDPEKCEYLNTGSIESDYFIPNTAGYGCWKRIYSDDPDIRWFGAKGDGAEDDTLALNHAISHNSNTLNFSPGTYLTSGVNVELSKSLLLDHNAIIRLKNNSNKHLIEVSTGVDIASFSLKGGQLDGNRDEQTSNKSVIYSTAKVNIISDTKIINAKEFAIYSYDITNVSSVVVRDSTSGIGIRPSREEMKEQISVTNCDIEVEKGGIEILKSSDNQARYESVLIENNRVYSPNITESLTHASCKSGLRFANNTLSGGKTCHFDEGVGGVIAGNIFSEQVTSVQITNYSTLNVTDNHFNGGVVSEHAITQVSSSSTFNNVYTNNHIENYSISCGFFSDENNEILFSGNTCHDAPLIISGACDYMIQGNRFLGSAVGVEIRGTVCSTQSGNIVGNKFGSNTTAILLRSGSGYEISRLSIFDNIFTNSGTCIVHDKNMGSIDDVSVMDNTFNGYIALLHIPTTNDIPSSLYWTNNKGDVIEVSTLADLQHGAVIFGEKYVLNDTVGLSVTVHSNNRAVGQQLKIAYNGTINPVTVVVPRHSTPGQTFTLDINFRYLVLEWSGRDWYDVTHRYATSDYPGIVEFATPAECVNGVISTRAVPPSGLKGLINDSTEVDTHTWSSNKITSHVGTEISNAIDAIPYATTSVAGLITLSTLTEAQDGLNSTKAITPVGLRGLLHDDIESNIKTWSSEKIKEELIDFSGLQLREESTSDDSFPILFTDTACCDKINDALVSPSQLFYVPSRGSLNSISFNSLSDERYKKNIKTVDTPLDIVNKLRGVKFDWKHSNETSYGVIAQELEKVLPDLVYTSPSTGVKNVNYDGIIGFLIEAIKELANKSTTASLKI